MNSSDYLAHILDFYNRTAHLYDFGEFVRRGTRTMAVELGELRPGDRVLDICTGTGDLALVFASRGANVVGVDISSGMLAQAAAKNSQPSTTWIEMDASQLLFADKTFDISTISLGLHHMPEAVQHQVLSEMDRVTRRAIVIVELNVPRNPRWWAIWTRVFQWLDESEYIAKWVSQDLSSTCAKADLGVERQIVTTLGMHRILLCRPNGCGRKR
jgi:ubiquinone/menaquinone biosynthesis C-methylase UbiE